jgi:hypothetical protein
MTDRTARTATTGTTAATITEHEMQQVARANASGLQREVADRALAFVGSFV